MFSSFREYYTPVFEYTITVVTVARDHYMLTVWSGVLFSIYQFFRTVWEIDVFGIPNLLLLLVAFTVFWNAWTGIKKSKIKREKALKCMSEKGVEKKGTEDYKRCETIYEDNKFNKKKLNFVFFKLFTFLAYLFFVKILLDTDSDNFFEEVLMFTSGLIMKVPTAWFWYTEFKSIGENSVIIYGQKPKIFDIVEDIFEARLIKKIKEQ